LTIFVRPRRGRHIWTAGAWSGVTRARNASIEVFRVDEDKEVRSTVRAAGKGQLGGAGAGLPANQSNDS
jgi:hypothetical protein